MFETIMLIIGSAAFGVIFKDHITIKNKLLNKIGLGVERSKKSDNVIKELFYELSHKFLNCVCISFWVTFIISGSFLYGCISYILAALIANKLNTVTFF